MASPLAVLNTHSWVPALGGAVLGEAARVAGETYLITTSQALLSGNLQMSQIALTVGFNLTAMLLPAVQRYLNSRWQLDAKQQLTDGYVSTHTAQPRLWRRGIAADDQEALEIRTALDNIQWGITAAIEQVTPAVAVLASLMARSAAFYANDEKALASTVLLLTAASGGIGVLQRQREKQLNARPVDSKQMTPDTAFKHYRSTMFANQVGGNTLNQQAWEALYRRSFADRTAEEMARGSAKMRAGTMSSGLSLVCLGAFTAWHSRRLLSDGTAALWALYGMKGVMESTAALAEGVPGLLSHFQRFDELVRFARADGPELDLDSRINKQSIRLRRADDPTPIPCDDPFAYLMQASRSACHIIIEGPTGSGKSMLSTKILDAIAKGTGSTYFYWPAREELLWEEAFVDSTGGNVRRVFEHMCAALRLYPQIKTIILDESDANLDAINRTAQANLIAGLVAENYCVLQITHRHGETPLELPQVEKRDLVVHLQPADSAAEPTPAATAGRVVLQSPGALMIKTWQGPLVAGAQIGEQGSRAAGAIIAGWAVQHAAAGNDATWRFIAAAIATYGIPTLLRPIRRLAETQWNRAALHLYDDAFLAVHANLPRLAVMRQGATLSNDAVDAGEVPTNQEQYRTDLFAAYLRWGVYNLVNTSVDLFNTAATPLVHMAFTGLAQSRMQNAGMVTLAIGIQSVGNRVFSSDNSLEGAAQEADALATQHRRDFWNNGVLGNVVNLDIWNSRASALFQAERETTLALARQQSWQQLKMACLASAAVAIPMVVQAQAAADLVGPAFVASLPRSLEVAKSSMDLSRIVAANYTARRAELARTLARSRDVPQLQVERYIQEERIMVSAHGAREVPYPSIKQRLHDSVSNPQAEATLWIVQAGNTAGKSMLATYLKDLAGTEVHLRPAHDTLQYRDEDIAVTDTDNLRPPSMQSFQSDGQQAIKRFLQELRYGPRVLILDESDAHLDPETRAWFKGLCAEAVEHGVYGRGRRTIVLITHRER